MTGGARLNLRRIEGFSMSDKQVAHMVFFTLTDRSEEAVQKLINACDNYLTGLTVRSITVPGLVGLNLLVK